jgi:hypothetical protein
MKDARDEEEEDEAQDQESKETTGNLKVDGYVRQINHFFFPCLTRE